MIFHFLSFLTSCVHTTRPNALSEETPTKPQKIVAKFSGFGESFLGQEFVPDFLAYIEPVLAHRHITSSRVCDDSLSFSGQILIAFKSDSNQVPVLTKEVCLTPTGQVAITLTINPRKGAPQKGFLNLLISETLKGTELRGRSLASLSCPEESPHISYYDYECFPILKCWLYSDYFMLRRCRQCFDGYYLSNNECFTCKNRFPNCSICSSDGLNCFECEPGSFCLLYTSPSPRDS